MTHPHITPKQQEIITLLYRFRFLDRTHIQSFLNHKNHKPIQLWLNDLVEKQYLSRNYITQFPHNTKPAVYYLAKHGLKWLRAQDSFDELTIKKYNREHLKSQAFIDKRLLLTFIYLDLTKRTTIKGSHAMHVASDYSALPTADLLNDISSDAYIIRSEEGMEQAYLLEVLADLPPARLRQRLKKYLAFYESNEWEAAASRPFPTILIICADNRMLRYCAKYLRKALHELDESTLHFRLTTHDEVKESGLISKIWEDIYQ